MLAESILLSKADAMWEKLQSRLDSNQKSDSALVASAGSSKSNSPNGKAVLSFEPPAPIVEKKVIVSKISGLDGFSSPSKDYRIREIGSPMRDTLTADLTSRMGKFGEFEPVTMVESPQNSTQAELVKTKSQAQLESMIFEGNDVHRKLTIGI